MKFFPFIFTAGFILLIIAGQSPVSGFELPKITPDRGTTYNFGYHYIYDNAGSYWDYERVYVDSGNQNSHYDRWYYHYGRKPEASDKQRNYPGSPYRKDLEVYSHGNEKSSKGFTHRKPYQLRDRIPSRGFPHTMPYNRARIGR